ncbi:MAG: CopL family metal-binding regulatory protein [Colwellia sp.]|nr:CopL family metal-binding regulatory protein [Colwellia sp.]MCW8864896.1 CopL family metal-binding regulatory protein [Colwellia sp.]MCW9080514.1 CopL family metal-binding regulatory protein [Colwellia sp.]
MTSHLSKTLLVLLVCLAFVGQAMASTVMSYHMMSMQGMSGQEPAHNMSMMDHSNHNMANASSDTANESTEDCCVKTCSCFAGGCSSVAAFINEAEHNPAVDLSFRIFSHSHFAQSQQLTSLYRPPILS